MTLIQLLAQMDYHRYRWAKWGGSLSERNYDQAIEKVNNLAAKLNIKWWV